MLRAVLIGLLLANVLFFGWTRGWFGAAWPPPGESQREPERVTAQLRPERFVLLSPGAVLAPPPAIAASAAVAAASASAGSAMAGSAAVAGAAAEAEPKFCLETGPLTAEQLTALNQTLNRLGVDTATLTEVPLATPAWMVFAGRFADTAARRTRLQAWQRQGVPVPNLVDEPRELAPGLVFSRHVGRAGADAALQALTSRHPALANVARVVQTPQGAARLSQLRAAAAPAALAQRLNDVALARQERFVRCAAP